MLWLRMLSASCAATRGFWSITAAIVAAALPYLAERTGAALSAAQHARRARNSRAAGGDQEKVGMGQGPPA